MSDVLIIHNPRSRRGKRIAARLRRKLDQMPAALLPAEEPRRFDWLAMEDLRSSAAAPERLLVVGGDGTVNAAAEWMQRTGCRSPLAIIPAGTGNNLARGLGIPLDLDPALQLALSGEKIRRVDAVRIQAASTVLRGQSTAESARREDWPYNTAPGAAPAAALMVQTAALGFPADIAAQYDRMRRRSFWRFLFAPAGPSIYRWLALSRLRAEKRRERRGDNLLEARLQLPEGGLQETVLAIFIGNEKSLGGNFYPCPRAQVDDGRLDICMIRAGTGASYLKLFRRVVRGEHLALEHIVVYRQTRGPVELQLSRPLPLLVDGDIRLEGDRYRLEMLPGQLPIIVP